VHVARVIWTGCREGKYPSVFGFNISVSRLTVLGSCSLQTAQDRPTSICNPFKTETRRERGTEQLPYRTYTKVCSRTITSSPLVGGMVIKHHVLARYAVMWGSMTGSSSRISSKRSLRRNKSTSMPNRSSKVRPFTLCLFTSIPLILPDRNHTFSFVKLCSGHH
jgi:hypothetical protein